MTEPVSETRLGGLVALLHLTKTHFEITPVVLSLVDEVRASRLELAKLKDDLLERAYDARRFKRDYLGACETIAEMHTAAMGKVCGPVRGVVEDIADLRKANETLKTACEELKAELAAVESRLADTRNDLFVAQCAAERMS